MEHNWDKPSIDHVPSITGEHSSMLTYRNKFWCITKAISNYRYHVLPKPTLTGVLTHTTIITEWGTQREKMQ